jgi:hypothetical protein
VTQGYDEATDAAAAKWWDALRARSVGCSDAPEWGYLWVGVMLRRYTVQHPDGLRRYRTRSGLVRLIREQIIWYDPQLPDLSGGG